MNKTHLGHSTFNIFLSFVHWACISEKMHYVFVLRRRRAQNCEIFKNSEWHSPFFQYSKYIFHFWYARKLANSSSFRLFFMSFFSVYQNMLHNQCRLHYLTQTGYKGLDRLCGLVVRVSGYRYRGLGFDSQSAVSSGTVRSICSEHAVRKECCSAFRVYVCLYTSLSESE